jgi:hypothetical protein
MSKDAKPPGKRATLVATYQYRDASGKLLYEVLRYKPKGFKFRRPDGKDGWIWNLEGVSRVLYRLPEIQGRQAVLIPEGEKDADNLAKMKLPATTSPGGARKWTEGYTQQLVAAGIKDVIVLPDNDEEGTIHATAVTRSCFGAGLTVRVVRLPGLPPKGDVSDWLAAGYSRDDLLNLIERTPVVTADTLPPEESAGNGGQGDTSLTGHLIRLVETAGVELFHDPLDTAFAAIPVKNHKEVTPLDSRTFERWLARLAWRELGKAVPSDVIRSALNILGARALYDGKEEPVHLRTAFHQGALYYDLGDPTWRVVKVTPEGWEIMASSPVRFRRYRATAPQVEPESGGSLDELWDFVNIPESHDRHLIIGWLAAALIPDIPRPLIALHGDQGSGKTTTAQLLASLIDPSHAPLVRAQDEAGFILGLDHHYAAILDNLSYVSDWLSDVLSRAVTGEGFTKRRLYTDADDVVFSFRRAVILTGINLVITKPDLLDRALIIGVERLTDQQRIEHQRLSQRFAAAQPRLFGALLDGLAAAMRAYPGVTLARLPRMADFMRWGAAMAVAQGRSVKSFAHDYATNIARQNDHAIAGSVTATVLLAFLETRGDWDGTVNELLSVLDLHAETMHIPKRERPSSPQALGRRLREVRPNLAAVGWEVSFSTSHHPRTVRITRARD